MPHSSFSEDDFASDENTTDNSSLISTRRRSLTTGGDNRGAYHGNYSRQYADINEVSPLLKYPNGCLSIESINPGSRSVRPSLPARRRSTYTSQRYARRKSSQSVGGALTDSLSGVCERKSNQRESDRLWYDQFTSVDWIHDAVADSIRSSELNARRDWRGRLLAWFDATEGWLIVAIIGFLTAVIAYILASSERAIFDIKFGYCSKGFLISKADCCKAGAELPCDHWISWSRSLGKVNLGIDFLAYISWMILLASISCLLTLTTRLNAPLAALTIPKGSTASGEIESSPKGDPVDANYHPPKVMYPAAGSGVAEVRVILSGFILHGFLGFRTLAIKTLGLIFSVNSGLSLGKEGPLVHIASCIGNVVGRLFPKYGTNEGKLRELLSAAAASGVAVAFGAPLSGVLFSLEDVSYYFPKQTLFRTFFCSLIAALSLKFLNPYSNGQIVLFQVHYEKQWNYLGMIMFMVLGASGGAIGALFVKASRLWACTFRRTSLIKKSSLAEIVLIALLSGCISFWNRYTRLPAAELLLELARPCSSDAEHATGLCPSKEQIPGVIGLLAIALVIKSLLTTITFGTKVPAGIYIPSMAVGGLLGRGVGHAVQYFAVNYPNAGIFSRCSSVDGNIEGCVVPGTYALLTAGATMCGVTRLTITLAVVMFELTGSLNYVLPFSVTIFVAKWTADAIEPLSIYDLLTKSNSYPFLEHKSRPNLTGELGDITVRWCEERVIDITTTGLVPSRSLRRKLNYLQLRGELDGGLSIVKDNTLIGSIPCPDLEFALDQIDDGDDGLRLCLVSRPSEEEFGGVGGLSPARDPTDLTPFIDPAPVALDAHAPMELVYECFAKLGLRYICVLQNGRYAGMLHKKAFVHYMHEQGV